MLMKGGAKRRRTKFVIQQEKQEAQLRQLEVDEKINQFEQMQQ